ncbi:VOC family protein [Paraburkholderia sp. LEh10]|uniref:VOC family protein n=1 Tax=Paraburkholderia sp. LEh10 TaxID=2821353 RepID=UPI001AE8EB4F|nr:VOC family protein [Paraburkholderia sp. LEh10]MBP0595724.1 VOC family protein [Paraburkholderia sp. LEh10]
MTTAPLKLPEDAPHVDEDRTAHRSATSNHPLHPLPPVLRPHHFGVSVPDLDAAIDWYGRMLGFALESQMTIDTIPARIAFLRRDGFRIELFEGPGAAPLPDERRMPNRDLRTHGNKHMCFEVPDVRGAVAALRAQGADVAFELVVDGNPTAFVHDVCGNPIELLQPLAVDKPAA